MDRQKFDELIAVLISIDDSLQELTACIAVEKDHNRCQEKTVLKVKGV